MIHTQKYVRKPLFVDAVRITSENFSEISEWCQGEILQDDVPGIGTGKQYIKVRVHNPKNPRQTKAFVGDWLLYTERGYKVYTNKAFHASFDPVEIPAEEPVLEEIEFTPATPEALAQAVKENEQARIAAEMVDAEMIKGKRVLTEREQQEMDPEELRELLRTGDVVLEQDLAA